MNVRVVWSPLARELLRTYLFLAHEKGRNPRRLKQAMRELNGLLARQPDTAGESRDGNERLVFVRPLSALYEVFPQHCIAFIYKVQVLKDA